MKNNIKNTNHQRLKKTRLASLLGLLTLVALVSGCSNQSAIPKIELSTTSFDLGNIDPNQGVRTETFWIKNSGGDALKIVSVSTSCGCTKARVESEEIAPGEQTELIVSYDPSVHPELVGKIERVVYIKSNDPLQEEVELNLVGEVLPGNNQKISLSGEGQ